MTTPRSEFLQQTWKRYPNLPSHVEWHVGRLRKCREGGLQFQDGTQIKLAPQIHLGPVRSNPKPVLSQDLGAYLSPGDWIAVAQEQPDEVWLLAPCLESSSIALGTRQGASREMIVEWSDFLQKIRTFFKSQDFLEAQTPTLVICPGTEPSLHPFRTQFQVGSRVHNLSLPTSPELHLKKMLALNWGPLFEIKSCFRNGEITDHHEPEFSMLEWYRPFANLAQIQQDLESLVTALAGEAPQVARLSVQQLFQQYAGLTIQPQSSLADYRAWAVEKGLKPADDDTISDLFHRLFLEFVEPQLPADLFLFVEKFPPFQAAYARLGADGWAERFELYWQGLEIANAFHEINDPDEQDRRMQSDLEEKAKLGLPSVSLDPEFSRALRGGLPPSSGIAVGVDRLFMAVHHIPTIQMTRLFSAADWIRSY